jgi:hypothetical protein
MSDYTTISMQYNTGTDASPTWTGTAIAFSGAGGANEWRWADTGTGATASTGSAAWPYTTRPASGVAPVRQLWAFSADTTGLQVATYDGARTNANVLRFNFDNLGTLTSAPRFSAFANTGVPTPSPGTQIINPTDGANMVNGHATDTSSTSYLKGNAYGSGLTAPGVQETPAAGAPGTTLAATSGTNGAATPAAASWLSTWQSLQGWTAYIQAPATPKAGTAFFWYITLALFMGVNMLPGTMPFCPLVLDYTWA